MSTQADVASGLLPFTLFPLVSIKFQPWLFAKSANIFFLIFELLSMLWSLQNILIEKVLK